MFERNKGEEADKPNEIINIRNHALCLEMNKGIYNRIMVILSTGHFLGTSDRHEINKKPFFWYLASTSLPGAMLKMRD